MNARRQVGKTVKKKPQKHLKHRLATEHGIIMFLTKGTEDIPLSVCSLKGIMCYFFFSGFSKWGILPTFMYLGHVSYP